MLRPLSPEPPARQGACPPAVDLEALASGEALSASQLHLASCPACRSYVEGLRARAADFLRARPKELFLRQLDRRAAPRKGSRLKLGFALAATTTLAVVAVLHFQVEDPLPARFKGSWVSVHLKRGQEERLARPGELLRAEDALRFSVRSDRPGFAAVLERDGRGKVQMVAPFEAPSPQEVKAGSTTLEDAAILDDAPGPEAFVAVFAEKPFDLAALRRRLESASKGSKLECPQCRVEWLEFEKQP